MTVDATALVGRMIGDEDYADIDTEDLVPHVR